MKSLVLHNTYGDPVEIPLTEVFGEQVAKMSATDEILDAPHRASAVRSEISRVAMNLLSVSIREFFEEDKEGSVSIIMIKNPNQMTHEIIVRRHTFEE